MAVNVAPSPYYEHIGFTICKGLHIEQLKRCCSIRLLIKEVKMISPFCNIPSAHIGPFRLRILYQCLSLHAGDSSSFSSTIIRIRFPRFLQTSLQLDLSPNAMVPWVEVWSNWGVRQTRFMATITFFPVPYPPRQAQSFPKKPPLKGEVRWKSSAVL